ncbi:hypothetical protein [Pantoea stewartii]|uniref:hypothetical protein n=1 Tax=Pantoea stewartii TaxID=66269 RepID=UPI001390327F|nr:hypothetical protein [Pantoea stewartii]
MQPGSIALTNNFATVTGTSFTTEMKTGVFIDVFVGNAPYNEMVGAIISKTSLSLTVPFNGTSSGLTCYTLPALLKIPIT